MLRAIKKTRIHEEVVTQIHDLIREGRLKAGDQLPSERELSETFKVSRTSVREALRALEAPAGAKSAPNTVWTYIDGHVAPVPVKLGLSDGSWTELVEAPIAEGTSLITRVVTGDTSAAAATPSRTTSPLMGSAPRGR